MARVLDLTPSAFTLDPPVLRSAAAPDIAVVTEDLEQLRRWLVDQLERLEEVLATSRQLQTFENLETEPIFGNVSGAIAYFSAGVVAPQAGFYKYEEGSWSKL